MCKADNLADLAVDVRLVVPKVDAYKLEATTAASTAPSSFPGLFGHIGKKAFVSDDRLLMTTQWRSEMAVVCINLAKYDNRKERERERHTQQSASRILYRSAGRARRANPTLPGLTSAAAATDPNAPALC